MQVWCMTRPCIHPINPSEQINLSQLLLAGAQNSPKCTYIVAQQHSWPSGAAFPWFLSVWCARKEFLQ